MWLIILFPFRSRRCEMHGLPIIGSKRELKVGRFETPRRRQDVHRYLLHAPELGSKQPHFAAAVDQRDNR